MSKNFAFTLAEVLITLGIIGVVAAMTLPTLIQNHKKHEVETKLAKVYSVVNQAIKMAEAEYGDPSGWQLECSNATPANCTSEDRKEWFMKYIGKNLKYIKVESLPEPNSSVYGVYLSDGTILAAGTDDMSVFLNKKALDNYIQGVNLFHFRFAPAKNDARNRNKYHLGKGFEPYAWGWDGTKEGLINDTTSGYGCSEEQQGYYCTKLIQMNGWKIPENYPRKL